MTSTILSAVVVPLSIPSPSRGVWHLGPVPVRAYALCIIAGVLAAVWLGNRRWVQRDGAPGEVADIAIWAVPFGLVGARLYHVITDHGLYFDPGRNPWNALAVWHGGLGIWGGIAGGALGAWLACRRRGILLRPLTDALAPALLLAQAIGRWGNYFNQELFGGRTDLPWGLEIDRAHWPAGFSGPAGAQVLTFHPTFLYECLWNLAALAVVLWLDRRLRLGHGRTFAVYVMAYCLGRAWIENLRIDTVEYNNVLGLRLNVWTSIVLFLAALAYFVVVGRRHRGEDSREASPYAVERGPAAAAAEPEAESADGAQSAEGAGGAQGTGPAGETPAADPHPTSTS